MTAAIELIQLQHELQQEQDRLTSLHDLNETISTNISPRDIMKLHNEIELTLGKISVLKKAISKQSSKIISDYIINKGGKYS